MLMMAVDTKYTMEWNVAGQQVKQPSADAEMRILKMAAK
jgi:hypothetical protein